VKNVVVRDSPIHRRGVFAATRIEPGEVIQPARFVNHSCNPDSRGSDRQDVAIRTIEAGEETTVGLLIVPPLA
jgi:hypothetical protein